MKLRLADADSGHLPNDQANKDILNSALGIKGNIKIPFKNRYHCAI